MKNARTWRGVCLAVLTASCLAGCDWANTWSYDHPAPTPTGQVNIPQPIALMLPQQIRIHPFTGTRVFQEQGGISGVDVRIEALDAFEDQTKAFGQFRFELYRFQPNSRDPKGQRLATWVEDVEKPAVNRSHWNGLTRTYQFKLGWNESIPVGSKFVLVAVFQSPYTPRLTDERTFIAGE